MSNKRKTPFFSVIMCAYDRAAIICRALDSLVNQRNADWEGIVMDDGSTDNTEEIIQPYLLKYPIYYYKKKHGGLAAARNAGMRLAKGNYITFLDTDDEYKPEHLQIRKKLLDQHPDIDLLHSNVTIIGNPYVPDKDHPGKKIHINDCVVGGTFCIKRSSLSPEDQFQDRFSDDSLFLEKWMAEDKNIQKADAPTYLYYRDSADSICNQQID